MRERPSAGRPRSGRGMWSSVLAILVIVGAAAPANATTPGFLGNLLMSGPLGGLPAPGIPLQINHQGVVRANGLLFDGTGLFRFAIVDPDTGNYLWTNDGSAVAPPAAPTAAVSIAVSKGLYDVPLGDASLANMTPISSEVFEDDNTTLRIWFDDGSNGMEQLTPDHTLSSVPYAYTAGTGTEASAPSPISGSFYRWAVFNSYDQASGWFASNNGSLFGGVNPSIWGDGNGRAHQMSADKDVLRTLFTQKGYAGKNATVYADAWSSFSSTNSKHAAALFRIRNNTMSNLAWPVTCYHTAYGGWSERASVALNGVSIWDSGAVSLTGTTFSSSFTHVLIIPANRTSTAIFISASSPPSGDMRSCVLIFHNNSLNLPPGLEFVDDLDTATGGWEQ